MPKSKFNDAWKGRETGIFPSWQDNSTNVTGFTGAEYKSFNTRSAVEADFLLFYDEVKVKKTANFSLRKPISDTTLIADGFGVGEFLAINHTLARFKQREWEYSIYSDSETAMKSIRNLNSEMRCTLLG